MIAITTIAPISVIGTVVPKITNACGSIGITAFPNVRKPMPIYPIIYRRSRMVARNRADGLKRFSKYSGIERTFEYTIIGNQPNMKKAIKNQSFKYVMDEEIPC